MTNGHRPRFARRAATALGLCALLAGGPLGVEGQTTPAPAPDAPQVERLSLPGRDWALDLALPGYAKVTDSLMTEGRGRQRVFMATPSGTKRKLLLLVLMKPAPREGDGAAFREHFIAAAKKNGVGTSNWKSFEYAGLPLLKYRANLPFMTGTPLALPGGPLLLDHPGLFPRAQSLTAFLGREGVWVEITLMAESVGEKEEKVFYAVLDTVKLVDTSAPATSFDFFHKGRPLYAAGEHAKAAEFYRRALDLERRERRLDAATLRALVEEAAVALATAGDFESAARAVEFGLAQEPADAVLHYLMAGVHAARGDLDATIASLRLAFQHKSGLPAGRRLPDPRKHPPFQRFAKDEKFR
jgi:hypothetical protein